MLTEAGFVAWEKKVKHVFHANFRTTATKNKTLLVNIIS